jgi:asparagine synthase (glutamine-hydrolysing)
MTAARRFAPSADVAVPWIAVFGEAATPTGAASVHVPGAAPAGRKLWLIRGGDPDPPAVAVGENCAVVLAGHLHQGRASDVLWAYLRQGQAALRRLRGRFVLLVWDCKGNQLVAARDPLGHCPLFYATPRGALFVSMSADALFRRPEVSREFDPVTAASWVGGRWDHHTFFRSVSRLPPGHWLLANEHGLRSERYWRPEILTGERPASRDAVHEEFDFLMSRAVDRCLDVGKAAIFLSGGLDSATIAAAATVNSRKRGLPDPVALCIEFPGHHVDESAAQRELSSALGIPRVALPFEDQHEPERTLLETLETASWLPLPPPTLWFSTYCRLAHVAAGRGCRTAIGGEGAEWFAHNEVAFAADLLRRMDLAGLYNLYVAERQYSRTPRERLVCRLLWESSTRVLLRDLAARLLLAIGGEALLTELIVRRQPTRIPSWIAPDPHVRRGVVERWAATAPRPQAGSFEKRQRLGWLDLPDVAAIMDQYHARSQHLGIDWQDGFYDADLIEFLLSVPFEFFLAEGHVKTLARSSVRRRLPHFDLRLLGTVSFHKAHEALFANRVRRAFDILGGLPVLRDLGAVDPEPVRRLAAGGRRDSGVHFHHLWYAFALEAWLQARTDSTPTSQEA